MAIARQSLTNGTTVLATSQTESATVSAGSDLLMVVLTHAEVTGGQATAVTFGGVSLTKLVEAVPVSFGVTQIWYLKNPAVSTANVVATLGALGTNKNMSILVFTGVDQTTTFRTSQTTTGSSTSTTLTVPSVASGDYVLDALTLDSTGHNTTGGSHPNQTIEYDLGMTGSDRVHSSQAGVDGGVMSHTWTTSTAFGYVATALIPTAAAAAPLDVPAARVFPMALAKFRKLGRFLPFPLPDFGPALGGITYAKAGDLIAGVQLYGADVSEFTETGSLTTRALTSGADSFQPAETGTLAAAVFLAGADVFTAAETGSLTVGAFTAGADVFTAVESGSLTPDTSLSGADAATLNRTGSITTGVVVSGADAVTFVESGTVMTQAFLSGVASTVAGTINVKAGSVTAGVLTSGTDSFQPSETGSLTPSALLSGADAHTATKTGSVYTGTSTTGADSVTYVETGSLRVSVLLSGIGSTVVPLPWMEATFTASSTLEGNAGAAALEGAYTTTNLLEGNTKSTGLESSSSATGVVE